MPILFRLPSELLDEGKMRIIEQPKKFPKLSPFRSSHKEGGPLDTELVPLQCPDPQLIIPKLKGPSQIQKVPVPKISRLRLSNQSLIGTFLIPKLCKNCRVATEFCPLLKKGQN